MELRRLDKNASSLAESKQGVLTHVRLAESSPDYGFGEQHSYVFASLRKSCLTPSVGTSMARCTARWFEEWIVQLGTGEVMPTGTIVPVLPDAFSPAIPPKI